MKIGKIALYLNVHERDFSRLRRKCEREVKDLGDVLLYIVKIMKVSG